MEIAILITSTVAALGTLLGVGLSMWRRRAQLSIEYRGFHADSNALTFYVRITNTGGRTLHQVELWRLIFIPSQRVTSFGHWQLAPDQWVDVKVASLAIVGKKASR